MKHLDIKFTEDQRDNLVIEILTDTIVHENVIKAVNQLARVFEPNTKLLSGWECGMWDGDTRFNGILKAYPLMGFQTPESIEEEEKILPITSRLSDIYECSLKRNEEVKDGSRKNAEELAEKILIEWKEFLNAIQFYKAAS